jgi:nucleoside 2-deoxyribosyltransferase
LSKDKPNVYYELGFAQGLRKPVIITAHEKTDLPFDVADIPTIKWEGQKDLKDRLREKIKLIASAQGR